MFSLCLVEDFSELLLKSSPWQSCELGIFVGVSLSQVKIKGKETYTERNDSEALGRSSRAGIRTEVTLTSKPAPSH